MISRIMYWRLIKKHKKTMTCPSCHGNNVELINQMEIEADYCIVEEYLCHDCDCEWDWTPISDSFSAMIFLIRACLSVGRGARGLDEL
jgi:hypothetical protein